MTYVHVVALLAVAQLIVFGILVGAARGKYGVAAPAMTGNEHFERAVRVQMNTLEQMICFLPALLIAAAYWPPAYVAAVGVVYLVGRILYRQAYVANQVHHPDRSNIGGRPVHSGNQQRRQKANQLFQRVHVHPYSPLKVLVARHRGGRDTVLAASSAHQHAENDELDNRQ